MLSIGIDAVEIKRFVHWQSYSFSRLNRVFSQEEISYCLSNPLVSAQRFAVRFAAKEAFYKAFSQATQQRMDLMKVLTNVSVSLSSAGIPRLTINWMALGCKNPLSTSLSLTHTQTSAYATVLLELSSQETRL